MPISVTSAATRSLALLGLMLAAGCVPTRSDLNSVTVQASSKECTSADAACYFRNSPVRLSTKKVVIPGRPYEFYPLAVQLEFVDGQNRQWIAPRNTLTDGASIPEVFVSVIGNPREPEFANAAALHDAYCGIGNEDGPVYHSRTWQEVHRLFYDGLIVGGTPEIKAKLMFAAVWLGGPRWDPRTDREDRSMQRIPAAMMQATLRDVKFYIQRGRPSLSQLINYLEEQEDRMLLALVKPDTPPKVQEIVEEDYDGEDQFETTPIYGEDGVTPIGGGKPGGQSATQSTPRL